MLNDPTFYGTMSGSMNSTDFIRVFIFTLSLSVFVFGFTIGDIGYPFLSCWSAMWISLMKTFTKGHQFSKTVLKKVEVFVEHCSLPIIGQPKFHDIFNISIWKLCFRNSRNRFQIAWKIWTNFQNSCNIFPDRKIYGFLHESFHVTTLINRRQGRKQVSG